MVLVMAMVKGLKTPNRAYRDDYRSETQADVELYALRDTASLILINYDETIRDPLQSF